MYKIVSLFLCYIFFSSSSQAMSTCGVNVADVMFSVINPLSGTNATANTAVVIICTPPAVMGYNVSLSTGSSGTFTPREMQRDGGGGTISYNLYSDPTYSTIFQNNTIMVGNTGCPGAHPCVHTVYGRILLPQPAVTPGSYSDTITVTLDYN